MTSCVWSHSLSLTYSILLTYSLGPIWIYVNFINVPMDLDEPNEGTKKKTEIFILK